MLSCEVQILARISDSNVGFSAGGDVKYVPESVLYCRELIRTCVRHSKGFQPDGRLSLRESNAIRTRAIRIRAALFVLASSIRAVKAFV